MTLGSGYSVYLCISSIVSEAAILKPTVFVSGCAHLCWRLDKLQFINLLLSCQAVKVEAISNF